jgi:hypothetical protein
MWPFLKRICRVPVRPTPRRRLLGGPLTLEALEDRLTPSGYLLVPAPIAVNPQPLPPAPAPPVVQLGAIASSSTAILIGL